MAAWRVSAVRNPDRYSKHKAPAVSKSSSMTSTFFIAPEFTTSNIFSTERCTVARSQPPHRILNAAALQNSAVVHYGVQLPSYAHRGFEASSTYSVSLEIQGSPVEVLSNQSNRKTSRRIPGASESGLTDFSGSSREP